MAAVNIPTHTVCLHFHPYTLFTPHKMTYVILCEKLCQSLTLSLQLWLAHFQITKQRSFVIFWDTFWALSTWKAGRNPGEDTTCRNRRMKMSMLMNLPPTFLLLLCLSLESLMPRELFLLNNYFHINIFYCSLNCFVMPEPRTCIKY